MLTFLEAFLGYKESPLAPAMKAMLEVRRPLGKASRDRFGVGVFSGRSPGMTEAPEDSDHSSDTIRKRVSE